MPEVFTPSTVIRIHFPESVWSNRIPNIYYVVQNPPAKTASTQMEMDDVYALPFTRCAHPDYENWEEFRRPQRSSSV